MKEILLARNMFAHVHSVALKYELAEADWGPYFDAAKEELEKDSK